VRPSTIADVAARAGVSTATVARLAREMDLKGRRVVIVGAGAVGLRAAKLLADEGCDVTVSGIPASRFGDKPYRRARGLSVAEERGMQIVEPGDDDGLTEALDGATLVLAAGPTGLEVLPAAVWQRVDSIEVLADFNAAEPLGIEGTDAQDDLAERDGKRVLGALAIGGAKMKVHKACVQRLFESNDAILDVDGVYEIAKGIA
jgi:NAD(P)-dependent dehydrogenase (short-subunit alcohol dehydrogenase family)